MLLVTPVFFLLWKMSVVIKTHGIYFNERDKIYKIRDMANITAFLHWNWAKYSVNLRLNIIYFSVFKISPQVNLPLYKFKH